MLEIRYNKSTKELTGWWFNRPGNLKAKLKNRPNQAIATLDIPIPDKPLGAWLFAVDKLMANPDYIEPEPPRNLAAELDELKAEVEALK